MYYDKRAVFIIICILSANNECLECQVYCNLNYPLTILEFKFTEPDLSKRFLIYTFISNNASLSPLNLEYKAKRNFIGLKVLQKYSSHKSILDSFKYHFMYNIYIPEYQIYLSSKSL